VPLPAMGVGVLENTVVIQSIAVVPLGMGSVCPLVDNTTPGGMVNWLECVSAEEDAPAGGVHVVGMTAGELLLLVFPLAMFMSPIQLSLL